MTKRKLSPEHRARIGAGLRGRPVSAETRAKMRAALQGQVISSEVRAKMSAARSAPIGSKCRRGGGYIQVMTEGGWRAEHRVVAGLTLHDPRIAHHRNGDRTDNRRENLQVMSRAEHMRHHCPARARWEDRK